MEFLRPNGETCRTTGLPLEHSPSPKLGKQKLKHLGKKHMSNIVTQQVMTFMIEMSTCKVKE